MDNKASLNAALTCLLLAGIVSMLMWSGCGCAHVPYSAGDTAALTFAIAGQAADTWTTERALDRGCTEGNPLYGSDPSDGKLIIGKVAMLAVLALVGEVYPESRQWLYGLAGGVGFGAAAWNYREAREP